MTRAGAEHTDDKAALRRRFLAARAALPEPIRDEASAQICTRLRALAQLERARALLAYAAFGAEVRIDPYLQGRLEAGVGVLLPWIDGDDLGIARIRDLGADLAPGARGVREPRASGRRRARPDRVDAAIIPGVAFDRHGTRLGYGGGHFDRLLARLRPATLRVGVCFSVQLAELLPAQPHDQPVDVVVTEQEVVRLRRRGSQEP